MVVAAAVVLVEVVVLVVVIKGRLRRRGVGEAELAAMLLCSVANDCAYVFA